MGRVSKALDSKVLVLVDTHIIAYMYTEMIRGLLEMICVVKKNGGWTRNKWVPSASAKASRYAVHVLAHIISLSNVRSSQQHAPRSMDADRVPGSYEMV